MGEDFRKPPATAGGENASDLQSFDQYKVSSPCKGCSAPCCNMFILPYPTPFTFMQLDFMRFVLGFPGMMMLLNPDGSWQIRVEKTCRFFDSENRLCKIHGEPGRSKTCEFFNPYNCFYKKNFIEQDAPDVVIMNLAGLERFISRLKFNDKGDIIETIGVQDVRELLAT